MRQQRKAMQPLQHRLIVSLNRTDSEIRDMTIGQAAKLKKDLIRISEATLGQG